MANDEEAVLLRGARGRARPPTSGRSRRRTSRWCESTRRRPIPKSSSDPRGVRGAVEPESRARTTTRSTSTTSTARRSRRASRPAWRRWTRGDYATAQREFIEVLRLQPQLHFARDLLGMAYLNNDQPAEAHGAVRGAGRRAAGERGLSPAQGVLALPPEAVRAGDGVLSRGAAARRGRHARRWWRWPTACRAEAVRGGARRARPRHQHGRAGRFPGLRLLHAQGADPAPAQPRRPGGGAISIRSSRSCPTTSRPRSTSRPGWRRSRRICSR